LHDRGLREGMQYREILVACSRREGQYPIEVYSEKGEKLRGKGKCHCRHAW
jgi:hypothetical protein